MKLKRKRAKHHYKVYADRKPIPIEYETTWIIPMPQSNKYKLIMKQEPVVWDLTVEAIG